MNQYSETAKEQLNNLMLRYPKLEVLQNNIWCTFKLLSNCFDKGGKLLVAGNGGSASDAEHITGELMKSFHLRRDIKEEQKDKLRKIDEAYGEQLASKLQEGFPTISLVSQIILNTAIGNDTEFDLCYAQQINCYGNQQDIFWGISTSGNSKNIINAAITAKSKGMFVIALTGSDGGRLTELSDITINVPEVETYKIQELHLPVYHCICLMLEEQFWGNKQK